MHAGPQQRLAALRVRLALAGQIDTLDRDGRAVVDQLGQGLDAAIRDLDDTVRPSDRALMARQSLGAALRASRRSSPISISILDRGLQRHPAKVELAIYYCCLEGIQNAIKHAGPGVSVTIRLSDESVGVGFSIEDDGIGFDPATVVAGLGLANIKARISDLGGTVTVTSTPGRGTTVRGMVPNSEPKSVRRHVAARDAHSHEEMMALRAAVVHATDTERQRIARNLHDGAQQRLVAIRVRISLAIDQMDDRPEDRAVLQRLGNELDDAIEDLRGVSRRFLNPYVVRSGVAPAIRSITSSWPIVVTVDDTGLGRHTPATNLAVYNCCLEALLNSREHGGSGVTVNVRLTDGDGTLAFTVIDDGIGFDPENTQPGAGLLGIADRAAICGGSATVASSLGGGVAVVGWIPEQA